MTDRARVMFPLMPDEVFRDWLGELIAANGWPFDQLEDAFPDGQWSRFFLELPVATWAQAVWSQETFKGFPQLDIEGDSKECVMQVAMNALGAGSALGLAQTTEGPQRVSKYRQWLELEGTFPNFITALRLDDGKLMIVDGHHRLAALWISGRTDIAVPAWIAIVR